MGIPDRRGRLRKKWELLFVCKPWVVSIQSFYMCDFSTMFLTLLTIGRRPSSTLFQSTYFHREHASKVRCPPILL
jgi:hypothetical protein